VQVHAACTGVWGFRASSGIGQTDGQAAVAGSLDSVGWACQNPRDLQLIGDALKLPGSGSFLHITLLSTCSSMMLPELNRTPSCLPGNCDALFGSSNITLHS